jgi:hypothetical protein
MSFWPILNQPGLVSVLEVFMNTLALVMVLASAVSHATWNFLAKRGIRLLAEGEARRRLIAAGMIVVGNIVLAFS